MLTRQWLEQNDAQQLLFWLATDTGPLLVEISESRSVCFVAKVHENVVRQLLKAFPGSETSEVSLQSFAVQQVIACYFSSQRHLNQFRQRVGDGFELFEADLRPTDRYLMERYLQAEISVVGEFEQREKLSLCA